MTKLQRIEPASAALTLHETPSESAHEYASAASAPNTRRAYRSDWRDFTDWCEQHGSASLPASPTTLANYVSALAAGDAEHAPLAVATLERRLVAITRAHQLAGHPSPASDEWVRTVVKGIRRAHTSAQQRVAPIGVEVLRQALAALPATLPGARDRALLLLGFASASSQRAGGADAGRCAVCARGPDPDLAPLED